MCCCFFLYSVSLYQLMCPISCLSYFLLVTTAKVMQIKSHYGALYSLSYTVYVSLDRCDSVCCTEVVLACTSLSACATLGGVCRCAVCAATCLPSYISLMWVCTSTQTCLCEMRWLMCKRGRQSVLWATGLNLFVCRHLCVCERVWLGGVCQQLKVHQQVSACEGVRGSVGVNGSRCVHVLLHIHNHRYTGWA